MSDPHPIPLVQPVAGVDFHFMIKADVVNVVSQWRTRRERHYITLTNPHSVMICRRDKDMRTATRSAELRLPDGVGVILAAKILGYGRRHRVTGPALMLEVCDRGRQLGFRHYFIGGAPGIADRLVEQLSSQFPGLAIAGSYCPPFRALSPVEDLEIVDRINSAKPDVVWVGLGAPKQEKWMHAHRGLIRAPAMIGVGAAFDFHSGNVQWAPGLVRKCGLEWAYRLVCNPRRMWRRNLDSPLFLIHVLAQAARMRLSRQKVPLGQGTMRENPAVSSPISPSLPSPFLVGLQPATADTADEDAIQETVEA